MLTNSSVCNNTSISKCSGIGFQLRIKNSLSLSIAYSHIIAVAVAHTSMFHTHIRADEKQSRVMQLAGFSFLFIIFPYKNLMGFRLFIFRLVCSAWVFVFCMNCVFFACVFYRCQHARLSAHFCFLIYSVCMCVGEMDNCVKMQAGARCVYSLFVRAVSPFFIFDICSDLRKCAVTDNIKTTTKDPTPPNHQQYFRSFPLLYVRRRRSLVQFHQKRQQAFC